MAAVEKRIADSLVSTAHPSPAPARKTSTTARRDNPSTQTTRHNELSVASRRGAVGRQPHVKFLCPQLSQAQNVARRLVLCVIAPLRY
jgi:hypothetical protein